MAKHCLDVTQILAWADAWQARTGRWPRGHSGAIPGTRGMRWDQVDTALRAGSHGLPCGSSLSRLLAAERGVPRYVSYLKGPLTEEQILACPQRQMAEGQFGACRWYPRVELAHH
jgi:hypothetical protein